MAIPDKDAVQTMVYGFDGSPFVQVAGKTAVAEDSLALEFGVEGAPFVAAQFSSGGAPPPENPLDRYIMVVIT